MNIFEKLYIIKLSRFRKFILEIIKREISKYFRIHILCKEF